MTLNHFAGALCAATILVTSAVVPASAAAPTKAQAKCVGALNAAGLGVARTSLKLTSSCLKSDAKGKLTGSVGDCVAADAKGKLAAAFAKTVALETKLCTGGSLPDFAATDAATVNIAASSEVSSLIGDLLGDPLPSAEGDRAADGCRSGATGAAGKLMAAEIGAFNACKKTALPASDDAGDIAACLAQVAPDVKVAKAREGMAAIRTSRCPDAVVADALPGHCAAATGAALDTCLTSRASCRACEALAAMDALTLDCDLFDDGTANSSCPGGVATTTTTTTSTTTSTTLPHSSCAALLSAEPMATSGVYTIAPVGMPPFDAYCDMTTDGGGWTAFQHRFDGSVNFARNWAEYAAGFGTAAGEYWLGNERIHAMTAIGSHQLYIAMNDGLTDGYAKYSNFSLGDAAGFYVLSASGFSGNVGDGLGGNPAHNGLPFSTIDADHDADPTNCSSDFGSGGWWFNACHRANLNGTWYATPGPIVEYAQGLSWYYWHDYYWSLASSTMMLR